MKTGFYISQVRCEGLGLSAAILELTKGANLITGASDTGKSYVFSVMNYIVGRSKEPKDIPESIGYTDFYLEIKTFSDDRVYTLLRIKNKDRVSVKQCAQRVFKTDNTELITYRVSGSSSEEENISDFLLQLCGLSDKKLLSSKAKGNTQRLSFSNINQLTTIAEDRIITEESPFYPSGQVIFRTQEQSMLNVLLTKRDFSDIKEKEDKEKRESSINGKLEYIASQLSSNVTAREQLINDLENADQQIYNSETLTVLQTRLKENLHASKELLKRKSRLNAIRGQYQQRLSYNNELLQRFAILSRQYTSDRKRLEFVLEAENLSSQLGNVVCPICTSPLDSSHIKHITELENFKTAIDVELTKIDLKINDLGNSVLQLKEQNKRTFLLLEKTDEELEKLELELKDNLTPSISELQTSLAGYIDFENKKNKVTYIDEQIKSLYATKDRFEQLLKEKIKEEEITILEYTVLSELCDFINDRLKKWNYESLVTVVFDSAFRIFDIVISGKSRRSYGKGKRSISYTACLLGILDFCLSKQHPFSNLIILDSPLTTFEEKKKQATNEAVEGTVLNSFFTDLGNTTDNCQIIIFDNKTPRTAITGIRIQVFTGDELTGRRGFF